MKFSKVFCIFATLMPVFAYSQVLSVCDRTPQVKKTIMKLIADIDEGIDCSLATGLLNNFKILDLGDKGITKLKQGDFSGFSSLKHLYLDDNNLTSLPAGLFNGLESVELISLQDNNFSSFPPGLFLGLPSVQRIQFCDIPLPPEEQTRIKVEVYSEHIYRPTRYFGRLARGETKLFFEWCLYSRAYLN